MDGDSQAEQTSTEVMGKGQRLLKRLIGVLPASVVERGVLVALSINNLRTVLTFVSSVRAKRFLYFSVSEIVSIAKRLGYLYSFVRPNQRLGAAMPPISTAVKQ